MVAPTHFMKYKIGSPYNTISSDELSNTWYIVKKVAYFGTKNETIRHVDQLSAEGLTRIHEFLSTWLLGPWTTYSKTMGRQCEKSGGYHDDMHILSTLLLALCGVDLRNAGDTGFDNFFSASQSELLNKQSGCRIIVTLYDAPVTPL